MSVIIQETEYDSGQEDYEDIKDEVEGVVQLLESNLEINYFERTRGDAIGQVQSDTGEGTEILEYALEGSSSNLGMRDKYLVLE